ncbi:Wall-associated receptor kinase 2 [Linum perenne]
MKINSPPVTAINVLLLLLLLHLQLRFISSADVISDECSDRCGNITVPYPFGIGNPKCAISSSFLFNCNSSQLVFGRNIAVQNISIEEGTFSGVMLAAYRCYNETGSMDRYRFNPAIRLGTGPFRFSNVYNKLTAFGCDTLAFMTDSRGTFGSGCVSLCDDVSAAVNATSAAICAGIGCCQSSIPLGLKTLNFTVSSSKNHRGIVKWNPCDYAFLADFPDRNPTRSSTAIEWVVEEKRCDVAKSNTTSYACRANSDCVYSENGNGYRCLCKPGFRITDIDECAEPEKYPCHGKCKNTVGDYTCNCPVGMRGDGKVACQGFRVTAIVAVIGGIILLLTIILLTIILYKRQKKEKNFLQNGGMLLQHQRVRIFKESELSKATNNYDSDHFLGEGGFGHVYKGILSDDNNTPVAIKKPKGSMDKAQSINQEFQHEIAVVSQVNHINVVKVVGLCLETKLPILVYEFIANGTLFDHIHKQRSRVMSTWPQRLRIATEIAQALDYLHSLANPPIIHGDIKSTNILLDSEFRAKVSDFGASVLISPDQPTAILNKIQGTLGYLDPEYLVTGNLNPKSDVYSFGVVMVELLTGEKPYSGSSVRTEEKINLIQYFLNSDLDKITGFWGVVEDGEMEEMEAFAEVARRCLNFSGLKRPAMKEVAEELGRLRKLKSFGYDGTEEMECLLGKSNGFASSLSFGYSEEIWVGEGEEHPPPATSQTHSVVALDMESYEIFR